MLRQRTLNFLQIDVARPVGSNSVRHDPIRLCKTRPHVAELSVATHHDLVAGRKQVAHRCLNRAASGRMHGKYGSQRPKHGAQHVEHFHEFFRELRRAMVNHGSRAGTEHTLRNARRTWRHQQHFAHSITPFLRSNSSTSGRKSSPRLISAMRFASRSTSSATSASTSSACARGTTAIPSPSPTTMSPGITTTPPQLTGTLISPGPSLSHAPGLTLRLNAGNFSLAIPSTSRIAPSTTMPPSFLAAAVWHIISPNTALVVLPVVDTTTISPGSATLSALW